MSTVLTRRSALQCAAVGVVGAVAGFVAARGRDPDAGNGANAYGEPAAAGASLVALTDVPDGGGVVLDDDQVVVVRHGTDVQAFSAVCTHQGCLVTQVTDGRITCPCHGSVFSADTGAPVQGPATAALPRVAVTVQSGEVLRS